MHIYCLFVLYVQSQFPQEIIFVKHVLCLQDKCLFLLFLAGSYVDSSVETGILFFLKENEFLLLLTDSRAPPVSVLSG